MNKGGRNVANAPLIFTLASLHPISLGLKGQSIKQCGRAGFVGQVVCKLGNHYSFELETIHKGRPKLLMINVHIW